MQPESVEILLYLFPVALLLLALGFVVWHRVSLKGTDLDQSSMENERNYWRRLAFIMLFLNLMLLLFPFLEDVRIFV